MGTRTTYPSQDLQAKLNIVVPTLMSEANTIWRHPNLVQLYPIYLETMHMVVRSSVSLMDAAIDTAKKKPTDSVASRLINYLEIHREEERGHDQWLLEDYAVTGGDPEFLRKKIPSTNVAEMVGAQYYWLYHYHPVSLLGHMAALEGNHPPLGFAEKLSGLSGYPIEAFRAIKRHEVLDIYHKQELYELIDNLALTAEHKKIINLSGMHTMCSSVTLMATIIDSYKTKQEQKMPA
ncbi:hypothetical protein AB835_03500 [Candidatus Endobugula sertula]|uniref:Iron-containing redox enzyme family protein n=1 Tax=Candidatus Endobugula sertula TaxID=62101 RepID=A0A1D2QSI0_9GAMM|nr:hypothetical protein AB835_03500 [Candidatus Endobugula sertula]